MRVKMASLALAALYSVVPVPMLAKGGKVSVGYKIIEVKIPTARLHVVKLPTIKKPRKKKKTPKKYRVKMM